MAARPEGGGRRGRGPRGAGHGPDAHTGPPPASSLAVVAAAIAIMVPTAWGQVGAILLGAFVGLTLLKDGAPSDHVSLPLAIPRSHAVVALILFVALLIGLPLLAASSSQPGSPRDRRLLPGWLSGVRRRPRGSAASAAELVPNGWVNREAFLAGYGAAQAVPGPCLRSQPISARS